MSRNLLKFFLVVLPCGILAADISLRFLLPKEVVRKVYRETGPIEAATAVVFALTAGIALLLVSKSRGLVPTRYRVVFLLYALAAALVAMEEVSYGQQLLRQKTPTWLADVNEHGETNLHNLWDNEPSHMLNRVANVGSIIAFLVLPMLAMWRIGTYSPGHWSYYMLPRAELLTIVALTLVIKVIWDLPERVLGEFPQQGLNELREFYWGVAALGYVIVMQRRLLSLARGTSVVKARTAQAGVVRAGAPNVFRHS